MKHASLFSGIGGFDLAAEWMGWENVFHCEWMEFPRKVLDYYWPDADSHTDICKTNFKKYANKIDILTGGFPCQPFSVSGKRKGTDDERYLWGEMLRAIQEIKPKYVIAENVFGITNIDGGLVFEKVCLDLETEGYEVQPFIIPAASKNAPHRRDRVWFIAYSKYLRCPQRKQQRQPRCEKRLFKGLRNNENVANTNGRGIQTRKIGAILGKSHKQREERRFINVGLQRNAFNPNGFRLQGGLSTRINVQQGQDIQPNRKISKYLFENRGRIQFENFPTQPAICGGNDGISTKLDGITFSKWRAESIKGFGNAIVPEVALEIFKAIKKIDCDL
jgi:DNA (cytosine-5)-methyltransferase 1